MKIYNPDVKKLKISYYLNIVIVALEIFSLIWMMSGLELFVASSELTTARIAMFKYFTVDSNFIMLLSSLIFLYDIKRIIKCKAKEISSISYIIKLMSTVSVTLTMIVTIFFLAPTMGLQTVFANSNLFLHIINPVLSIITFVYFEKTSKIKLKHTFTACLPLIIYSIYYVTLSIINLENGHILPGYDWYGFFFLGIKSVIFILPIIIVVTYLISLFLWKFNRKGMIIR